ncbi:MAG: hypothetical protein MJ222_01450 [Bacilli bacterium]|nr:hypothetical protein [Bacilli bacterium]
MALKTKHSEAIYCECCKKFVTEYYTMDAKKHPIINGVSFPCVLHESYCLDCGCAIDVPKYVKKDKLKVSDMYRRRVGWLTRKELLDLNSYMSLEQINLKTKISILRLKLIINGEIQTENEEKRLRKLYNEYVKKL